MWLRCLMTDLSRHIQRRCVRPETTATSLAERRADIGALGDGQKVKPKSPARGLVIRMALS
jgi:hypothetical protein